jgi:Flp pilus assembly protein TadB
VNPGYVGELLESTTGILMLVTGAVLLIAGALWLKKIVDIEV